MHSCLPNWETCKRNSYSSEDGIHFRRQHAIDSFITDFCAPRRKLVIEFNGSQHLDQKAYDEERTKYLELRGYQVLRFWNNEVMNHIDDVLNVIWNVLHEEPRDAETHDSGLGDPEFTSVGSIEKQVRLRSVPLNQA